MNTSRRLSGSVRNTATLSYLSSILCTPGMNLHLEGEHHRGDYSLSNPGGAQACQFMATRKERRYNYDEVHIASIRTFAVYSSDVLLIGSDFGNCPIGSIDLYCLSVLGLTKIRSTNIIIRINYQESNDFAPKSCLLVGRRLGLEAVLDRLHCHRGNRRQQE